MGIPPLLFLLPLLFHIMCVCSHVSVVSGFCLEDQQSLLLQLKSELKFHSEESTKLVSWNPLLPCCKWRGVTCDDEGHVAGLNLSGEGIYGGLDNSSALFSLIYLQNLSLWGNDFNSPIPPAIKNLKNLTSLDLSDAQFVGHIPIEISHLTRLVTLDLSSLFYYGDSVPLEITNLQKLLQNLTGIRILRLDGIWISAQGQEWSNALLALPGLEELSMRYCDLSGPIESSLAKLENLSIIVLDGINLLSTVPETFANLNHLTKLSLSNCGLRGKFPQKIFQIQTLSFVDISYNYDLRGLLPDLPLSGSLETLKVSNTYFSGALPNSISNLKNMSYMDLSHCSFVGILPSSLSNLTKLTYLDLSFNSFFGSIPSFVMLKKLTFVDLSHNNCSGAILSNHFRALQNLVHLDLSNNFLSGRIPSSLFALSSLKEIYLSYNDFDGQMDEFSISSSSTLNVLDLSNNHLEGPIPLSVFKLSELQVLQLSSNKFTGIVKLDMIRSLRNLTTLHMSYNNLLVDLNTSLDANLSNIFPNLDTLNLASCKLKEFPMLERSKFLTNLDLSNNEIEGLIPNWIWKLENLYYLNLSCNFLRGFEGSLLNLNARFDVLDLHSNQLQGQIPIFSSGSFISYLDYSNNNFSSLIPSNIGTFLSSASYLYLSKNKFYGMIPHSLCNTSYLLLDLSNNNLEGTIPECLMFDFIEVLSLENNMLNGSIPDTFPESCFLKTLDLHGNQLSGPIPKSLSNCMELEALDLGNNQINGVFPCWLKKISKLRVMVLRANKFQGSVKCLDDNATWPLLQIVDLASNNFSGLLPTKVFTTMEAMINVEDNVSSVSETTPFSINGSQRYYRYSVTITSKGREMEFFKILTFLTSIDFSSNNFEGPIARELMKLKGLYALNLSHNALSGQIPSSIDNLKQLESLDLSKNYLSGEIPTQLAALSFLDFLNLSFNHLVGKIPTGTQLQSFEASSYVGNDGLYGPPLTNDKKQGMLSPPASRNHDGIDLKLITGIEFGVVFGLGIVIGPLFLWKQWRIRYWKCVDNILCSIFPQLYLDYQRRDGRTYTVLRWRH